MEKIKLWSLCFLVSVEFMTGRYTMANEHVVHLNCSLSCTDHDAVRQLRVDGVKSDILRMLGMTSPPILNNTVYPDIPLLRTHDPHQHDTSTGTTRMMVRTSGGGGGGGGRDRVTKQRVWQSYEADVMAASSTSDWATTLSVISFAEPASSRNSLVTSSALYFSFDREDVRRSDVMHASLGVHMRRIGRHSQGAGGSFTTTMIIKVSKVNSRGLLEFYNKTRVSFFGSVGSSQWVVIDVTQLVVGWVNNPSSNHGLVVNLEHNPHGHFVLVTPPISEEDRPHTPYMEVHIRDRGRSPTRARRTTNNDCQEHSSDRLCCRYPLIVNFDLFHWDWIVAPRQYPAYYCSGECPYVFMRTNPLTHLAEQSTSRLGAPCCTSKSLSPISLLYFDVNMKIVRGVLPGMVVNSCGCV